MTSIPKTSSYKTPSEDGWYWVILDGGESEIYGMAPEIVYVKFESAYVGKVFTENVLNIYTACDEVGRQVSYFDNVVWKSGKIVYQEKI